MRAVLAIYLTALMGCSIVDGYEFGDGTRLFFSFRTVYCNALPEAVRDAALARMQSTMENYPEHSICDTNGFIVDVVSPQ